MDPIRIYEHSNFFPKEHGLPAAFMESLEAFRGEKEHFPYYTLIRGGARFHSYVGALQVGKVCIEVLPKIDRVNTGKKDEDEKKQWHNILIDMLKQSGMLKFHAPSSANLRLKGNSILDLYMSIFLDECEHLLHRGLVKRYRKTEGNRLALKGALVFGKHIAQNVVHQERFYVRHTVYDTEHPLNQILLKTIQLIKKVSSAPALQSRVGTLLLNFPELPDLKVTAANFERLRFDRKTEAYRTAIEIAKLLLLNFHPDVRAGRDHVLALMFDMNKLWEKWVLRQMQSHARPGVLVQGQASEDFWTPENGTVRSLRPDILLKRGEECIVIDTKWKLPNDGRPGDDDLKQMFAYNNRYAAGTEGSLKRSILLYPGEDRCYRGEFFDSTFGSCELRFVQVGVKGALSNQSLKQLMKELDNSKQP